MKERASEPSHLRPPLDSLTFNSNNHSSHAAMQRNQQNDGKAEGFDAPLFQPLFTSYMQIQYFFYDVEILCTLLPWCSRVIPNHSVISDSYRTVPTSTNPYCTLRNVTLPLKTLLCNQFGVLVLCCRPPTRRFLPRSLFFPCNQRQCNLLPCFPLPC